MLSLGEYVFTMKSFRTFLIQTVQSNIAVVLLQVIILLNILFIIIIPLFRRYFPRAFVQFEQLLRRITNKTESAAAKDKEAKNSYRTQT